MAEAVSPTQSIIDQQARIRNTLGAAALELDEIMERVPGHEGKLFPLGGGGAISEPRFLFALEALGADSERLAEHIRARVKLLRALL
jgi:hypothetical protein